MSYLQKDIADLARRIGLEPSRSVGGVSAFELMKVFHEPPADGHWKSNGGTASTDIFFISIYPKLEEYMFATGLMGSEAELGPNDPFIQAVLNGRAPADVAK